MKYLLLIITALLAVCRLSMAQETDKPRSGKIEAIEKIIIAHITRKLDLTTDEAGKFWPVFNQYRNELHAAAQNHANDPIQKDEAILVIRKKFKPAIGQVLGAAQRVNRAYVEYDHILIKIRAQVESRIERQKNRPGGPQPEIPVKRGKQWP